METKPHTKANAAESRNENLTCWRTTTNPQCLRVETSSEFHLFPYGYFRHAKLWREANNDIVEIDFQGATVVAMGKSLESLYDALARLGVERIRICPAKYEAGGKEGTIMAIAIRQNTKPISTA